jgi:hypothetical protein
VSWIRRAEALGAALATPETAAAAPTALDVGCPPVDPVRAR